MRITEPELEVNAGGIAREILRHPLRGQLGRTDVATIAAIGVRDEPVHSTASERRILRAALESIYDAEVTGWSRRGWPP